jgi:hypothetical protein
MHTTIWLESPKERDNLNYLGTDGTMGWGSGVSIRLTWLKNSSNICDLYDYFQSYKLDH